jgi:hypothetical protein
VIREITQMRKNEYFRFRINDNDLQKIEDKAKRFGFYSVSEFVRQVCLNVKDIDIRVIINDKND